jgi:hypothetical protein
MYSRRVGPGNAGFRWAASWWEYPEALARIDALWRAWEHLRLDGATGHAPGGSNTPTTTCQS